ncbi:MAG TPA: FAD-dependent oxidoreductase [Candidatus Latescibacteria bacterium]|nr:FAD-dependent oxidoreductase [Candidatus Latescibacterota bacterium]
MITANPEPQRSLKTETLECDLAVVGGGLAGVCAALTAARAGLKVVLMQDRPVLGGNASSEVRLWGLGATCHMSSNNRWARESGAIDEILVENHFRNPEGNAVIFDTVLLEWVLREPNITLLLNTAAFEVAKSDDTTIARVKGFCAQNSVLYDVGAKLFCDASGDGILGFLSGAAFRMGAEAKEEFNEPLAPSVEYGELLGHSIYFMSKDVGVPVRFVAPSYALKDIKKIPRFKNITAEAGSHKCHLWWFEYGGRLDTVHDTEKIKWELWKVAYGAWDYIKNSGKFPEAANLTLEWMGCIPGKRESRRFEGDYMLTQGDIIHQRHHEDAVSYGGWSIDLHPADGVYSPLPGCNQWHARGVYEIPYRTMYSRNITNLFLAGRLVSSSHVAFGSTRVMLTCAESAQAVGLAAALCVRDKLLPKDVAEAKRIKELQTRLLRTGQFIPRVPHKDPDDLAQSATITATSSLKLSRLDPDGTTKQLTRGQGLLLPLLPGPAPKVTLFADVSKPTKVRVELRTSDRPENHTPDVVLGTQEISLPAGENQPLTLAFDTTITEPRYALYCVRANEAVSLRCSGETVTGVMAVAHRFTHEHDAALDVETYEVWAPERDPLRRTFACQIDPPIAAFSPQCVANGFARPTCRPNAWVADFSDDDPVLALAWGIPQTVSHIQITFDTDWEHPMESVLWPHHSGLIPFCVKDFRIFGDMGALLHEEKDNHQTRVMVTFPKPVRASRITIECLANWAEQVGVRVPPAAIYDVQVYGSDPTKVV